MHILSATSTWNWMVYYYLFQKNHVPYYTYSFLFHLFPFPLKCKFYLFLLQKLCLAYCPHKGHQWPPNYHLFFTPPNALAGTYWFTLVKEQTCKPYSLRSKGLEQAHGCPRSLLGDASPFPYSWEGPTSLWVVPQPQTNCILISCNKCLILTNAVWPSRDSSTMTPWCEIPYYFFLFCFK